jgi:hypothetical protein
MAASKRPADELKAINAPHELIEWVRKLPPEAAARSAWVDAPRADWVPWLAVVRGISRDAIVKAVCETAVEVVRGEGPEMSRLVAILRDGTTRGRDALLTAEADLADLRLAMIEQQSKPGQAVAWMFWAELVLELARSQTRGNPLVGIALATKKLAAAGKGRPAHADLVARLRDKLTLAM